MSKPRQTQGDPKKRDARKRLRRASRAASQVQLGRPAQLDHASNPKGARNRRRGEEWLAAQPVPETVDEFPSEDA